jgi:hypothetical protein
MNPILDDWEQFTQHHLQTNKTKQTNKQTNLFAFKEGWQIVEVHLM